MSITIVGLGPAGLDLVATRARDLLVDPDVTVILRTGRHPASEELASIRGVITCDDLYDSIEDFDEVYSAIVDRVLRTNGPVVYAVPGSAHVGERAVAAIRQFAGDRQCSVIAGISFLDLAYEAVHIDPIADGLQVLDARDLPDPLPLHLPTIITQVDSSLRAADLSVSLGTLLAPDHPVTVLDRLGDPDQVIEVTTVADLARYEANERTSVALEPVAVGLLGLVHVNRILRDRCPWDQKQTHHTLMTHLLEEAYEAADALGELSPEAPRGDVDYGVYAEVEEELGDLLLQVVFHATLASEAGAFDIDEVAEGIRRKLVARHPHVFAEVEVEGAAEVLANWERIKQDEKQRDSLMDDIPRSMPAMGRAMKVQKRASSVGFDWEDPTEVVAVLRGEVDELVAADSDDAVLHELGDVFFSAVNLSRTLGVDPELALRRGVDRFSTRFRMVEALLEADGSSVGDASPGDLEDAWFRAKQTEKD